jgi:hypothetical protein
MGVVYWDPGDGVFRHERTDQMACYPETDAETVPHDPA